MIWHLIHNERSRRVEMRPGQAGIVKAENDADSNLDAGQIKLPVLLVAWL
jgi:hypothetical protein